MPKYELNTDTLYAALNSKRESMKMSWKQIAVKVGVGASTLTRLAQGKRPDADALSSLLVWLELDIKHFIKNAEKLDNKTQNTVSLISALLKSDANLSADSAKALDGILRASYDTLRERED